MTPKYENPFRPGAGHRPPFLAGREREKIAFRRLLAQNIITDNAIVTGLRGVGKTVLLDVLKEIALSEHWWWVGTDMTESTSLTEDRIATRLLADLAVVTSQIALSGSERRAGIVPIAVETRTPLNYETLSRIYEQVPGLVADKLKAVLELVWRCLPKPIRGIVFAYDEAQNLSDHAADKQFPLSLVLEVFQALQPKGVRFLLALTGLPPLFPKLVEARTSAERMFHVQTLGPLSREDSRQAILRPIQQAGCPPLSDAQVDKIVRIAGGYPYFLQFICREVYDVALSKPYPSKALRVPIDEITRKLDADFFSGRWTRATDRQRDVLSVIAAIVDDDDEFAVQQVVKKAAQLVKERKIEAKLSASQVSQILSRLAMAGLVYKNRHGRYLFAIPLLAQYIRRQG
jgi:DNA-binding transcriptional ArsR family regulator